MGLFDKWLCMASLAVVMVPHSTFVRCRVFAQDSRATVDGELLPNGQRIGPAGQTLAYKGRPVAVAVSHGETKRELLVKDMKSLGIVAIDDFSWSGSLPLPDGASMTGMVVTSTGEALVSTAGRSVLGFTKGAEGTWSLTRTIELPSDSYPCGLTLLPDERSLIVCLSKQNKVVWVSLDSGAITAELAVGIAPYSAVFSTDGQHLYVSNLGGDLPQQGDRTAKSAGSETRVDERGIATEGTISCINVAGRTVVDSISVGLHPSEMLGLPQGLIVCNTNQDSVSIVDWQTREVREIVTKPVPELPFGSMPNGLALTLDGRHLFVALSGNNAVAVMDASDPKLTVLGYIPTAWFPTGLACSTESLYIANTKGFGSRSDSRPAAEGLNSHDHQGAIQKVALSEILDPRQLAQWTEQVVTESSTTLRRRSDPFERSSDDASIPPAAVPVPEKLGAPSCFQHVIYVIKENRTFDQVFGDIPGVRGDPKLCVFPDEITPNHHALAKRFGVLDNYYCNGVLSADGHSWATEGNVTPYLERAFGGFGRSYTFGDDPLTYSSSGFVWDHVLAAGLSFRNYGEMDYATPPQEGMTYQQIWDAYESGQNLVFGQQIGIDRLARYSCREYPGWNMLIPDVLRMDRFLNEFQKFDQDGGLPNLSIVYLPQDHLGGGITGRSHMADNDLAVGRLVAAVSKSQYWPNTLIMINEDDPQDGFDHIDGHRSICLVVSAYSRPGVNHDFANQTSVLRTILHVLGIPPMNQQDMAAPLMTSCFTVTPQNLDPYEALVPSVPLNERPAPVESQSALERQWRELVALVPIERTGMKTKQHDDQLNRFMWHEQKGWESPYPEEFAGAHGKGLAALGLIKVESDKDD